MWTVLQPTVVRIAAITLVAKLLNLLFGDNSVSGPFLGYCCEKQGCRSISDRIYRAFILSVWFYRNRSYSRMGRPKLHEGGRTKKIGARFTEAEYDQIAALEKQLGLSETDFVRMRLLNEGSKHIVNARDFLDSIDQIGAEIGRVGNNINQLAKHANVLNLMGSLHPSIAVRFNELFEQYLTIQQSLETTLRKIIRAMGK